VMAGVPVSVIVAKSDVGEADRYTYRDVATAPTFVGIAVVIPIVIMVALIISIARSLAIISPLMPAMFIIPVAVAVTKSDVCETNRHAKAVTLTHTSIEPAIVRVTLYYTARRCSGTRKHERDGQALDKESHRNFLLSRPHWGARRLR